MKVNPRKFMSGFSLIEVIMAMSVFLVLALVIVQITSATSHSVQLSNRPVDAAAQARLVLDRLGMDFAGLVRRPDFDLVAVNDSLGTGNILRFFSMVASTGTAADNRKMSLVAYQLATHRDNHNLPCLIRAGMPVNWSQTGFFGLKANGLPIRFSDAAFPSALLPQNSTGSSDYDILAPGVIQMVIGFKLSMDNQSVTLSDSTQLDHARGQIVYSPPVASWTSTDRSESVAYVDLSRVDSLVVGIVAIDLDSLKLLQSAAQINALAACFPAPSSINTAPLQVWYDTAGTASQLPSSVPLAVRQSIRVFQRSYPMTSSGTSQP
ncbi:MAG: type II secretion system protein J [Chthoniobacteraceae bacterium]